MWKKKVININICEKNRYYRDKWHSKSYTAISIFTSSERYLSHAMKNNALCYNMNNEYKMKHRTAAHPMNTLQPV